MLDSEEGQSRQGEPEAHEQVETSAVDDGGPSNDG